MPKIPKELINSLVEMGAQKVGQLADKGVSGISKHFPNKESLVEVLIQREADRHLQILEEKYKDLKDEPFEKIIETLIIEIAQAMEKGKVSIRVILTSTFASERLQSLITARESLATFVEKVLNDGGYTENSRVKSHTIVAALGGMVETVVFKKDNVISEEVLAKETTKLVLAYIKA